MPQGFALTGATSAEIVAAFTVGPRVLVADPSAIWESLGEFFLPLGCVAAVDLVHIESAAGVTLHARLWDVTAGAGVATFSIASLANIRSVGPSATLLGGRTYQMHAKAVGAVAVGNFASIFAGTITG
jgi:hypothetical protein